jgi:hypothetical protein
VRRKNSICILEDRLAATFKSKHALIICSAISLLCIYLKELKTHIHTKTCTQTFVTALFIIATTLEAINMSFSRTMYKLWYIQTKEYYTTFLHGVRVSTFIKDKPF